MSGCKAGKPMTAQRSIDDIGLSHYSSDGGTTCSVNKRLVGCETCGLLTALREAQNQSAFWEHEYNLAKDSRGERDALQRRVEALERAIRILLQECKDDVGGTYSSPGTRALEAALRGSE